MVGLNIRKSLLKFYIILVIICIHFVTLSNTKSQYVQPLIGGMQVAIPYDIANIFNRPVNLGPIAGVLLSFVLLSILFFGVITSPFGYMFGIPSEKYVTGQPYSPDPDSEINAVHEFFRRSRSLNLTDPRSNGMNTNKLSHPDFLNSIFQWLADVREPECQKLVLCHAHRAMEKLPKRVLTGYQFFSKKLVEISDEYKQAIHTGLTRQKQCEEVYPTCPETVFGIAVRSIIKLMPKWTRKKALKPHLYF